MSRCCDYHEAHGHTTDWCSKLKDAIEEYVKNGKLEHLVKTIPGGGNRNAGYDSGRLGKKFKDLHVNMTQGVLRGGSGQRQNTRHGRNNKSSSHELKAKPTRKAPLIITAFFGQFRTSHSFIDAGETSYIMYRQCFDLLDDEDKRQIKPRFRLRSQEHLGRRGGGLFLVSALSLLWLRAFQLKSRFRKYVALFDFPQACGIQPGTQVRIRGVTVGNVIRVNPSLKSIEAVVEVADDKTIIPRNALVEVNQSGLLMETMIDITPQDPIPTPSFGPLDPDCVKEGVIVCDRHKLRGYQGVSLDALIGIFTRLGREVEQIGVANTYALAERAAAVIEEARPLLLKIQAMAEDVQPMLSEVRDSGLLQEVESLTKSLAQATEDLRKTHACIMTPENTELIQKSIYTLVFTLKNIESLSSDILGFTGDEATRKNLKLVIKSLSSENVTLDFLIVKMFIDPVMILFLSQRLLCFVIRVFDFQIL
ncbi:protein TRIGALACTOSYLDIACYLGLYCEROL 2, chloroplastic-like [Bidens hawaiensis]|uniref:protein TRIGALACTOSYLDIACYLGLYCEROL 2, chloroplastic-like n=1 Tax=Bidens hawaiensis TaxID=980011 RepID=UPI0040492B6E